MLFSLSNEQKLTTVINKREKQTKLHIHWWKWSFILGFSKFFKISHHTEIPFGGRVAKCVSPKSWITERHVLSRKQTNTHAYTAARTGCKFCAIYFHLDQFSTWTTYHLQCTLLFTPRSLNEYSVVRFRFVADSSIFFLLFLLAFSLLFSRLVFFYWNCVCLHSLPWISFDNLSSVFIVRG